MPPIQPLPPLRVAGMANDSVVDGPGIRLAVFLQGCARACPGCHNPETHALDGGRIVSGGEILEAARKNPLLQGVTFSGGEPFLQAAALAPLARALHAAGLDIVTYTGYTLEEIIAAGGRPRDGAIASDGNGDGNGDSTPADPTANATSDTIEGQANDGFMELLRETDILVDGPYIESLRTLSTPFVGSKNQRVIRVADALAAIAHIA